MSNGSLDNLTKKQLAERAATLGVNLSASAMKREDMINLIKRLDAKAPSEVVDVVDEHQSHIGPAPGRIRLVVAKDGRDKRQRPVFVGHNLRPYVIPRGKEVDFPAIAISCLTDAVEEIPVWDDELETAAGRGGETLETRQSYPFQILAFGQSTKDVDMDKIKKRLGY